VNTGPSQPLDSEASLDEVPLWHHTHFRLDAGLGGGGIGRRSRDIGAARSAITPDRRAPYLVGKFGNGEWALSCSEAANVMQVRSDRDMLRNEKTRWRKS
jgi:hypothetical protein